MAMDRVEVLELLRKEAQDTESDFLTAGAADVRVGGDGGRSDE